MWDYPRPPRVEPTDQRLEVVFGGITIADTRRAVRVLETSHPPAYYFPAEDVAVEYLRASPRRTVCEFKGLAGYWSVVVGEHTAREAVWSYLAPTEGYRKLAGRFSFYPGAMETCRVDGEAVTAQPGDFYGGWITPELVGPFKGGPGTRGW